jgi:hypothetical protein
LPTCCEQRVTYVVIGISDLELESTFLEHEPPLFHFLEQQCIPTAVTDINVIGPIDPSLSPTEPPLFVILVQLWIPDISD